MTYEERCEICDGFNCGCDDIVAQDFGTDDLSVLPQYQSFNARMANSVAFTEFVREDVGLTTIEARRNMRGYIRSARS